MKLPFVTLDVFTTTRYAGNPLAIVILPPSHHTLAQDFKQLIAREFNLSETVFLHRPTDPSAEEVNIDIFRPHAEIPFAGHPTIGSAVYILAHTPWPGAERVNALITKSGRIPIRLNIDSDAGSASVSADVAHNYHHHATTVPNPYSALGRTAPTVSIVNGMTFTLLEVPSVGLLGQATYPSQSVKTEDLDDGWRNGRVGTYYYRSIPRQEHGQSDGIIRVRARMLLPTMEDPATGSAACALSCYLALAQPSNTGAGPTKFDITQGVEMGRESHISVEVLRSEDEDGREIEKVTLSGSAVVAMRGEIEV